MAYKAPHSAFRFACAHAEKKIENARDGPIAIALKSIV
jgi:hypothetical protein